MSRATMGIESFTFHSRDCQKEIVSSLPTHVSWIHEASRPGNLNFAIAIVKSMFSLQSIKFHQHLSKLPWLHLLQFLPELVLF